MARSKAWGWVVCKAAGKALLMVSKTHKAADDAYAECRALNFAAQSVGAEALYSVKELKG
jgi:hypothetical protein